MLRHQTALYENKSSCLILSLCFHWCQVLYLFYAGVHRVNFQQLQTLGINVLSMCQIPCQMERKQMIPIVYILSNYLLTQESIQTNL